EHPAVATLIADHPERAAIEKWIDSVRNQSNLERQEAGKEGRFTGKFAINPFSKEEIPIWLGNFVLMQYGTGAIMAVPGHDERDFEFAKEFGLNIKIVVKPRDAHEPRVDELESAYTFKDDSGEIVNSGLITGLAANPLAKDERFVNATCPRCGGEARRETDTMDTFVDSSWYFCRFITPHDDTKIFDSKLVNRWLPVDQYIGGIEHAILHLLY